MARFATDGIHELRHHASCFGVRPKHTRGRVADQDVEPTVGVEIRGQRHIRRTAGPLFVAARTRARLEIALDQQLGARVGIARGDQMMRGYWNRPDETAIALRDGWMLTGDLAVMSPEGYFQIVGRKKDMINCRGFKVFPDEVDRVLMSHAAILEAATIGVPDPVRGETVKSFVVLNPGMQATADEIEAYARERLAAYKLPRQIEFIAELPKSTVLKVLRRELRDRELKKRA